MRRPGPEHERLNAFVGKWNTEGQTRAGPLGPAARVTARDTYEWFPGGFFLVHHVDGRVGDEQIRVLEIIGYDGDGRIYRTHAFDSQGNVASYGLKLRDGVWTFTGDTERATLVASADGNTMTATWERMNEDNVWLPWMDVELTRR